MSVNLKGKIDVVGRTDEGQIRDHNEDYISDNPTLGIAVLADGMGGLNAGEVASSMAVHLLMEALTAYRVGDSQLAAELAHSDSELPIEAQVVRKAVENANDAVFHTSQTQPQCKGMGTTIVASLFYNNKISIAHIGDSRVYLFRGGALEQVTKDHSFVQELIDKGLYTKEEARTSDKKNVVTRALGVAPFVEVECHEYETQVGDIYLMCSDGLHDMVPDRDIERAFVELEGNMKELANYLVDLANANGGKDNVSVILTRIEKPYPDEAGGGLFERIANWFE
ncbi:MAG: Stp1/IreP family PP2C-type Ser/Thr phosphatase [Pseudomonadales bacterium]|nr:Stp1/IreP family PP2C-type Ser/Thr phosphatase [Pseudomonadales bacterium]MBO6563302.1 Stp1/IreP family PP2C-type Ser/Thr phosphatase [Pseudomonadales bacterium]MBO6595914.1 Stp1/IreP family PP2C-type Ser/Thr phosphatase [Pseudomonadales bacterium]MBO6656779.1 Stp1/IreP family PP2C-type Ser/Thr phosphatase [Pseudomonadales bacterium]MBO6702519.1 Stp1/IreP family PP2C-type Ser/Thr phosphatase [Pseudomonadales bacterium]